MNWLKIISSEAFKEWLRTTGSTTRISRGNFRLDPFQSSMRKFNNVHTWFQGLHQNGTFNPTGRRSQAISDLHSAELFDKDNEDFSELGRLVFEKWEEYELPAGDQNYEIHRCVLLVYYAIQKPSSIYNRFFENWSILRERFSFEFLLSNKVYLYLFSYLDKTENGYNPFETIIELNLNEKNFDDDVDWDELKSYYTDSATSSAIDNYSNTINGYLSREGRSNICIAYEILSNGGIYIDNVLEYLDWTGDRLNKLKSILKDLDIRNKVNQTIYFGAPGTGKSHKVNQIVEDKLDRTERVTFHPEVDYSSFVGGYKPTMDEDDNIRYEFVPQTFMKIYVSAWNDLNRDYYLVIEEINRGNCAEIFGDIFQLLDRENDYRITPSKEIIKYLHKELSENQFVDCNSLVLPPNLHILATMNTSDQSLYPMDSAFKRRWNWVYVPINYEDSEENESSKFIVELNDNESFSWIEFIESVNEVIKSNQSLGMDKCIGNYFINPSDRIIPIDKFINKAIFYLWDDVFKDELEYQSIFPENTTYESFFPIKSNGVENVKKMLEDLDVSISN